MAAVGRSHLVEFRDVRNQTSVVCLQKKKADAYALINIFGGDCLDRRFMEVRSFDSINNYGFQGVFQAICKSQYFSSPINCPHFFLLHCLNSCHNSSKH